MVPAPSLSQLGQDRSILEVKIKGNERKVVGGNLSTQGWKGKVSLVGAGVTGGKTQTTLHWLLWLFVPRS